MRSTWLLLAAVPACLHAQTPTLDPIVVTPTRAEAPLSAALAPTLVITRDEIERAQASDVAELLRFHAGLDVARNGGPGQAASVFIRGAESNHTLVLVDGVRINPGSIGGPALQHISPESIERIEIVKGPRSSLWGADAIGGVVHIITRRAGAEWRADAQARGGSFGTVDVGASASGTAGNATLGAGVAALEADGFPTRRDSTLDSGYDRLTLNLDGGIAVGTGTLGARYWEARGTVEYVDFSLQPLDQDYLNRATQVDWAAPLLGPWSTILRLSRAEDRIRQNQVGDLFCPAPPCPRTPRDFADTQRDAVDWQHDFLIAPATRLTAGLYGAEEEIATVSFGSGFDQRIQSRALYAQGTHAGGGFDLLAAARLTDHEGFGTHTTGNLEAGFVVWQGARLVLAAGTGFRAPDATDRFGFGGNPDLEPESSRNFEVGLRQRLGAAQQLALAAFHNRIEDLIEFSDPDGVFGTGDERNRNVAAARIQGIEAGWRYAEGPWSAALEGIVQDPTDRITGERLPRRAGKSVTLSATRALGAFGLGLDVLAQGRRKDSAFSDTVNAGYAVVNLTGSAELPHGLRLLARVENLLDRAYQTAAGFNMPERSGYLTLRYELR